MPATSRARPWPVTAIGSFAWLVMACFAATLVAGFAAPRLHDVFGEYAGHFIWVPYLWIAGLHWWQDDSQVERRSIIRFTRWNLWLAIVLGLIDLMQFGWSSHEAGSIFKASEWRFVTYWPMSAGWLWLLREPAVTEWIETGARAE
jgi:hypothetical protein